jgi:hypothetical protein
MSDPTLPSFRHRLEQQPPHTSCGGLVRAHPSGSSLLARASVAPLCACNPVACANCIGTPLLLSWVTSWLAVAAPLY